MFVRKLALVRELALLGETAGGKRADAVRNRVQLLSTARQLLAEVGVDKVTMDGLAAQSGLGKGTVFRHFGDRAGIFQALLDQEERALQSAVLEAATRTGGAAARAADCLRACPYPVSLRQSRNRVGLT